MTTCAGLSRINDGSKRCIARPVRPKAALANRFATIPSADNDTPVQPQLEAMGTASGDPGGGESPVSGASRGSVVAFGHEGMSFVSGSGSSDEQSHQQNDLMSEATGVAQNVSGKHHLTKHQSGRPLFLCH